MDKFRDRLQAFAFHDFGSPRYEQLAAYVERQIRNGELSPGERLPTVRQLSATIGVSATTISAALDLLSSRRLVRAEVGRGTFVSDDWSATISGSSPGEPEARTVLLPAGIRKPWRRNALMRANSRLRASAGGALECSTGRPDPDLLPLDLLRRAWLSSITGVETHDLQYAGPEPIPVLADVLVRQLAADAIPAQDDHILIGTSAQQFFALAFEVASARSGRTQTLVAVEEPGYPTLMDTMERSGAQMAGVAMDAAGAIPASLEGALQQGAQLVVLTPRGQNPTGASWTRSRLAELARVLEKFPEAIIVEDDQVAQIAETQPGSLLTFPSLENRTVYIRSFSKSIAPDLRMAAAVARPPLRDLLAEAKVFADGWSSRLLQRVLATILGDQALPEVLRAASNAYHERRQAASTALNKLIHQRGGLAHCGTDGVNVWVNLPPGVDAKEVQERSAAEGVRIAEGEPFFVNPGRCDTIRLNAGSVKSEDAEVAGKLLGRVIMECGSHRAGAIHV